MRRDTPHLLRQSVFLALALSFASCTNENSMTQPPAQGLYTTPTGLLTVNPPQILIGAGDIASCGNNNDEATAQIVDTIPGTVMVIGDNVYENGTNSEFNNCYHPTWGRHKARTKPATGNHEYNTSGASGYYQYFGAAAGDPSKGYYSYDLGAWHIIVINSSVSMTSTSAQDAWLRNDIATHPNLCTLAYFHHPLYSSTGGSGSGGLTYAGARRPWDVMYPAGVDLVLGGHRHFYERLAKMKADGSADAVSGIREIIVGSGGIGGGSLTNIHPRSEVRNGTTFGVLKLYLYDDSYAWKFIPVAGKTFTDSGSTACHNPPGSGGGSGVSPSQSTVSAAPASFTAGSGSSTVTVTVNNNSGAPISSASVVVSATGTGNTLTPSTGTTNASGVFTSTLTSTGAGAKTVSASANGIAITQTAAVTVTPGPVSGTVSTVNASPASFVAGTGSSTITVTARDANGNTISGQAVVLGATGTGNTLTPSSGSTGSNGAFTSTLTSTVAEIKTVSATIAGVSVTPSASVNVTVEAPGGGTVTHTLLTLGSNAVNQSIFTTSSISPAPNALITVALRSYRAGGAITPTLSGGGMTSWTPVTTVDYDPVNGSLARVVVFRAMSASPGSGPLTITFTNSVSNVEWIVSQWSGVDASGVNGAGAIGQTGSARGDLVSALSVPLATFGNVNNVAFGVVGAKTNAPAVTPGGGFAEIAEVTSGENTLLETQWATNLNTIAASLSSAKNAALLGIEIKAGGGGGGPTVSPTLSTVTATSPITAGGGASSITVTARDGSGNTMSGANVVLSATGSGNTLSGGGLTNGGGVATGTLSSTVAGSKIVSATINGVAINQTATVTVNPPGPSVSASLSTVDAAPTSFTAGGSSTITVTVNDGSGSPMSGVNVTLSATGSGNTITQPGSPTNSSGQTTGTLASTGAGSKTVTAVAGGITLNQQPIVTVTAGPANAGQSTLTALPGTITQNTGTANITVTVRDQYGNPVNLSNVVLSATGTGNTLTGGGSTNASGVATGTLSSTVAEVKTVSATAGGTPITQTANVTVAPPSSGITHTLLTAGNDVPNQAVYTTASISPAANALVTIAVVGHRSTAAAAQPTVSGGGMSAWVEVGSIAFSTVGTPLKRMTIYRAMSASPGSGPITITFPATESNASWIVSQWTGVNTSGTNGSGAIGQTASNLADGVTSIGATLAALGGPNNIAYAAVGTSGSAIGINPGAAFTEISEQKPIESPNGILEALFAANQTNPSASWSGAFSAAILAIEIKAGP